MPSGRRELEPLPAEQGPQGGPLQLGGFLHDAERVRARPFLPGASWHSLYATEFAYPPREGGLRHPHRLRQLRRTDRLRPHQALHHPRLERGTVLWHGDLHAHPAYHDLCRRTGRATTFLT